MSSIDDNQLMHFDKCMDEYPDIKRLVAHLNRVFEKHDALCWLDAGSLLKFHRDSHLISSDLDIAAWQKDITKIVAACDDLRREGFIVVFQRSLPFVEDLIQIFAPHTYKVPFWGRGIDLYLYGEFGAEAVRRNVNRPTSRFGVNLIRLYRGLVSEEILDGKSKLVNMIPASLKAKMASGVLAFYIKMCKSEWHVVPIEFFKSLKSVTVEDLNVIVPASTSDYLEYRYGVDWETPKKNWRLAGGQLIRFRRLNMIPGNKVNALLVKSDKMPQLKSKHSSRPRAPQDYTREELLKIEKLD